MTPNFLLLMLTVHPANSNPAGRRFDLVKTKRSDVKQKPSKFSRLMTVWLVAVCTRYCSTVCSMVAFDGNTKPVYWHAKQTSQLVIHRIAKYRGQQSCLLIDVCAVGRS